MLEPDPLKILAFPIETWPTMEVSQTWISYIQNPPTLTTAAFPLSVTGQHNRNKSAETALFAQDMQKSVQHFFVT